MKSTKQKGAPKWDPLADYPLTFIKDTETAQADLTCLKDAVNVAVDTETVILLDENGEMLPVDLDVDGPGPWRVMSIAARFADGTKRSWVLDMGYIDPTALNGVFGSEEDENGKPTPNTVRPFGWHTNFDRMVLMRDGLNVFHWWDAMLADAVLVCGTGAGERKWHSSLAKVARKMLGFEIGGKTGTRLSYKTVEEEPDLSEEQIMYAAIDAIVTLELALRMGGLLRANNLIETFVRECNAQPFIQMMVRSGIPLDVPGYSAVVAEKAEAAAAAAEEIAVATTGAELLDALVSWNRATGLVDPEIAGLDLLHDPSLFGAFMNDLREQAGSVTDKIGELLGIAAVEDLFSDNADATFTPIGFDPTNDTEVRSWLSKQAPHFAAAYVTAAREEGSYPELMSGTAEEAKAAAGRRSKFTKDHDVEEVLDLVAKVAGNADVTEALAQVAQLLVDLRRHRRIIDTYATPADAMVPVRLVPTWNVGSDVQVKDMLNRFSAAEVAVYTARGGDKPRQLGKSDSVDADALTLLGGSLASALLRYRSNEKIVTTYGDKMLSYVHKVTGRIHARYNQALAGTGRLTSYKPNAQNFSPLAKPYMRPKPSGKKRRVFVCADLSQAELRFVASAAGDLNMLEAFRSGEDLHARTASLMFSVDMVPLKKADTALLADLVGTVTGVDAYAAAQPARLAASLYKELRQQAKAVAFGYAYGLKGAALAQSLTVQGVPTTKEEADALLAKFDEAYPQVAAWMAGRVAFIANLSAAARNGRVGLDVAATWRLHLSHAKALSAFNALQRANGYAPEVSEVVEKLKPNLAAELSARLGHEASEEELVAERDRVAELVSWALSYEHAVAMTTDGTPFQFESRTSGGRRRLFEVATDHLMLAIIGQALGSRKQHIPAAMNDWVADVNARLSAEHAAKKEIGKARGEASLVELPKRGPRGLDRKALEKTFEDRELRTDAVGFLMRTLTAGDTDYLWNAALGDRIRAMGNQYRNHPIQGGVADAMLEAFALITADLLGFEGADPIQSVHDSIVIECDVDMAAQVRDMVVTHMEAALSRYCPLVPCVSDGDVQLSLDDKTIVTPEQLELMVAEAA